MRPLPGLLLAAALCAVAVAASARQPASPFDPSQLKGPAHGTPNEVLVLGTAHLSQLPKSFDPAALRGLLDRLAQWRPQIVAIESMSGPHCAFGAALSKAWDNPATAQRKQADSALEARLATPEDVLAMYRAYNDPSEARLIFASDFGAALEEGSPQHYGRNYLGYWETRNLRMASNIRDAIAARPGSRTLVIVGAAHKGYLEAYLNQMHDVRIVNALQVLR